MFVIWYIGGYFQFIYCNKLGLELESEMQDIYFTITSLAENIDVCDLWIDL